MDAAAFKSYRRPIVAVIAIAMIAGLYVIYIRDLDRNPPGSYLDESAGAYNAYLLATTGRSEFGDIPLYPKYYTGSRSEQGNPTHLYMLAAMYLVVPPSVTSARVLAATTVFFACLLLGWLAARISQNWLIGSIVAVTAMFTPWLFDASRLVLEVFTYPLSVTLLLISLYRANRTKNWTVVDVCFVAFSLALVTYSYSVGRLLGPAFAFCLLVFARDRERFVSVIKAWIAYAVTLIPLAVFTLTKPGALSKRFSTITYLSWDRPLLENAKDILLSYWADISPQFLLYEGDPLLRHHVPGMGEVLGPTLIVAIVGIVLILVKYRRDPFWLYAVLGLFVSVLGGALTTQRFHALRLSAFPVFLLLLTVPAWQWLLGEFAEQRRSWKTHLPGYAVLMVVLILTLNQAIQYQSMYQGIAGYRGHVFDDAYLPVLEKALSMQSRPIYLEDGFWGPAYVHAFWYGTIKGLPLDNFLHLAENQNAPVGSLVLSSNDKCSRCQVIEQRGSYLLYRVIDRNEMIPAQPDAPNGPSAAPAPAVSDRAEKIELEASRPRGIAVDPKGDIFVTEAASGRILKISAAGRAVETFATIDAGTRAAEPTGLTFDLGGDLYVTDAANGRVLRYGKDGQVKRVYSDFQSPIDIEFGPDNRLYIADRGSASITRLDPETNVFSSFGAPGSGQLQFGSLTGIGSDRERIFAADTQNDRVQVISLTGEYNREWAIPAWERYIWHRPDLAVDRERGKVFVTNGWKNEVLVYNLAGDLLRRLAPSVPEAFNNVSSITVSQGRLYILNTGADVVETGKPSILVVQLPVTD